MCQAKLPMGMALFGRLLAQHKHHLLLATACTPGTCASRSATWSQRKWSGGRAHLRRTPSRTGTRRWARHWQAGCSLTARQREVTQGSASAAAAFIASGRHTVSNLQTFVQSEGLVPRPCTFKGQDDHEPHQTGPQVGGYRIVLLVPSCWRLLVGLRGLAPSLQRHCACIALHLRS